MKKVWLVKVGFNWSEERVIARNYITAANKALKIIDPPRGHRFISSVEFLYDVR